MIPITPKILMLVALTAFITQQVKRLGLKDQLKPYLPFMALAIAVGLAFLANIAMTPTQTAMTGLIIGVLAMGGYDVIKLPK